MSFKYSESQLPHSYIEPLNKIVNSNAFQFDISKPLIGVIIPVYGESLFIKRTLLELTVKQTYTENVCIICVYRKATENDDTLNILNSFKQTYSHIRLMIINEDDFPDNPCIGHARAIGFAALLQLAKKSNHDPYMIYMISSDADVLEADPEYIDKICISMNKPDINVISCQNKFDKNTMEHFFIKTLKVIDDGFFMNQFKKIGALNGRCYVIRGSTYLKTPGVNYTAHFDDIAFGIDVHKTVKSDSYMWIDSYIVTSDRRYRDTIIGSSLMDEYAKRKPLGLLEQDNSSFDFVNDIETFYADHFSQGFNVLAYYYAQRFNTTDTQAEFKLIEDYKEYINYINRHLNHIELVDFDYDWAIQLYRKYIEHSEQAQWWKNKHKFTLIAKINDDSMRHYILGLLDKSFEQPIHLKDIKFLSPSLKNHNQILFADVNKQKFVIKVYPDNHQIHGEENLLDSYYDLAVHKLIADAFLKFRPHREIVSSSMGTQKYFNQDYLIHTYIDGNILENTVNKNDFYLSLQEVTYNMLDMYKKFNSKSQYGFLPVLSLLNIEMAMYKELRDYFECLYDQITTYSDFTSKFFRADINRDASSKNKDALHKLVDAFMKNFDRTYAYALLHGDLKPKNLITHKGTHVPIDWSRAHYGDVALDFADILVSVLVYCESAELAYKTYIHFKDSFEKYSPDIDSKLKYFISFKLFSIARVFYPNYKVEAEEAILIGSQHELKDFFSANKWAYSKKF